MTRNDQVTCLRYFVILILFMWWAILIQCWRLQQFFNIAFNVFNWLERCHMNFALLCPLLLVFLTIGCHGYYYSLYRVSWWNFYNIWGVKKSSSLWVIRNWLIKKLDLNELWTWSQASHCHTSNSSKFMSLNELFIYMILI